MAAEAAAAAPPPFGAALRRYRLAAGLSQDALAERAGLSARTLSDLERGVARAPRPESLRRLAAALGLAPAARAALAAAARPAPALGPPPAPGPRHNLPAELTSFVGRARELGEVVGLLAGGPAGRLLTLTGPGGGGKTRLALRAAAAVVDRYPDGARFVDLAPLAGAALVPQAVLSALGLPGMFSRPAVEGVTDALRTRALLLVLDNCEHLLGACAALVDTLLRACPGVCVLATSRAPLGVPGEVVRPVPPLSVPDPRLAATATGRDAGAAARALRAIAESEAVRLFVERARLVQPAFGVAAANAPALVQVCARLDGLPLALELAAPRLRGLTVGQLAARLDDRFRLVTGGSRTAPRRQQTLRAAVDWSYDLLAAAERALLRRLSVFAGGWTLEAAEAVGADLPDVCGALLRLVDASLVLVDGPAGAAAGDDAEPRYRLLETIRQYAGEALRDAGEADAARDRHRDWYLAWAERAAPEVTARDQLVWLARLEAEHDNLRAALERSRGDGSDRELRLAAALAHFWVLRGYGEEGRARLRGALERRPPRPTRARAAALDWLGWLAHLHEGDALAGPLLEQAAAAARAAGAGAVLASALRHRATCLPAGGGRPAAAARALLEEALAAARSAGARREQGYVLHDLGALAFRCGDRPGGARRLAAARRLLRTVGDRDALSLCLRTAAAVALEQGDRAGARALLEEALTAARELGPGTAICGALALLGELARAQGDLPAARARYAEEVRVARDRGDRQLIATAVRHVGGWWAAAGAPARATRLLGAAVALRAAPSAPAASAWAAAWADRSVREDLAAARAALGPAAFAAAWAAGVAMPLDEAVADALADAPDAA